MGRTFCQVQTLVPPRTACLVCLWTKEFHQRLLERVVRESCDEFFERSVETFPSLPVLSGIAGTLAASETLAFLAAGAGGFAPRPGRVLRFDLARRDLFEGEVLANPECVEVTCRRSRRP